MKILGGWLRKTLHGVPWLLVFIVLRVPERLLEDRLSAWANHQFDLRTGGIMHFLYKLVIAFLRYPWAPVVLVAIVIMLYALIRELIEEEKLKTHASEAVPSGSSFWISLKRAGLVSLLLLAAGAIVAAILPHEIGPQPSGKLRAKVSSPSISVPESKPPQSAIPVERKLHRAYPASKKESGTSAANKGEVHGTDNTIVGKVPFNSITGNGNTIVGATDAKGNTILKQGGVAIGEGAKADSSSIAIGAHANAGGTNQQTVAQPGAIVQANSGGVNVQQGTTGENSPIINSPIMVGDVPKDISPQDAISLKNYFLSAAIKARVSIMADQFSGNAPFPNKFYDALRDGGWTMLDAGVNQIGTFSAPGKKFQGAVVIVKGEPLKPHEVVKVNNSDPMYFIGAALDALKVPRTLRREPRLPEGQITIQFVGGFPQ